MKVKDRADIGSAGALYNVAHFNLKASVRRSHEHSKQLVYLFYIAVTYIKIIIVGN